MKNYTAINMYLIKYTSAEDNLHKIFYAKIP